MGTNFFVNSSYTSICPACGYPSKNLCAACAQMAAAVNAYRTLQGAAPAVAQANPAA